jgi:hypothetical protein
MSRRDPKALPDDYDFHLVTSDRPIRGVDPGHPGQRPWDVIEEQQRWLYEAWAKARGGIYEMPLLVSDWRHSWKQARERGVTRAEASVQLVEITAGPPVMKRAGSLSTALLRELFEEEWTA